MTHDQLTQDLAMIARNAIDYIIKLERDKHELLEALKEAAYCVQINDLPEQMGHDWDDVIAKAEGQA